MFRSTRALVAPFVTTCASFITISTFSNNSNNNNIQNDSFFERIRDTKNFVADAVELVSPSVVNIEVLTKANMGLVRRGHGSGFIIDKEGHLITNAHVIANSLDTKVKVTLWNGDNYNAQVHSFDEKSDLALLKLNLNGTEDLPVAKIGKSSTLRYGEFVIALGSPLGFTSTATFGIISSPVRYGIDIVSNMQSKSNEINKLSRTAFIQSDCQILPGNSGGPLVNLDGEVIGINTLLAATQGGGLSFSIPIDAAMDIIRQLRDNKSVVRAYMGLSMQDTFRGVPNAGFSGKEEDVRVRVKSIERNSPAASAGFRVSDTILAVDGKPVKNLKDLYKFKFEAGKAVRMRVSRYADGREEELTIIPAQLPRNRIM